MTQDHRLAVFPFKNGLRSPEDFRQIMLQFLCRIHLGGDRIFDIEPDAVPVIDRDLSAQRPECGQQADQYEFFHFARPSE